MKKQIEYIVGIDEAGRGPLAGPVAVGALCIPADFNRSFFKGIKDSKQLTPDSREIWYRKIKKAVVDGKLTYAVSLSGSSMIDGKGIVKAISRGIKSCLKRLGVSPMKSLVLLDGLLKAPKEFKNQKTIIKGDEKRQIIAGASIMAKVRRDRHMVRIAKEYKKFSFHIHKGYGTSLHLQEIKKFGISKIHRKSFISS